MGGTHHHVYPSCSGMYFHIHIIAHQAEDDVEYLLVMSFVVGIVSIGNGGQECLQQMQGFIHIVIVQLFCH